MSQTPPTVEILLATYNGDRFLRAQIDSILNQTYPALRILARDDGSRDDTPQILAEYAAQHPDRFHIITGPPTGNPKFNFVRLLEASTANYVAFSDQDDVWLPEKIALSMSAMQTLEAKHPPATPLVVFTDLQIVTADLQMRQPSFWAHQPIKPDAIHSLRRVIMQNTITGNTALLNRSLATLTQSIPSTVHMHDWWVAVLAAAFGDATPIHQQLVLYRQHDANVLGASSTSAVQNKTGRYQHRADRLAAWETAADMARALLEAYGEKLSPSQRRTAQRFITIDESPSATIRVLNFLALRLYLFAGLRSTLAMLWLVADLPSARKSFHPPQEP
jgi:glycosyltransferase involved in cell wall biosynthesis